MARKKKKPGLPEINFDPKGKPGTRAVPGTLLKQSKDLGWDKNSVRITTETFGLYTSLPMVCEGEECYWASRCPTAPEFNYLGCCCPLEINNIYQNLVLYIREMKVEPDDYIDLVSVVDLVKLNLQISRIDQLLQLEGMEVDRIVGVSPKVGPIRDKVVNPLVAQQRGLRADRSRLFKELLGSRAEKAKLELAKKKQGQADRDLLDKLITKSRTKIEEIPNPSLPASSKSEESNDSEAFSFLDPSLIIDEEIEELEE